MASAFQSEQFFIGKKLVANLHVIVDLLISDHAAEPSRIFLATMCYDYAPDAERYLAAKL